MKMKDSQTKKKKKDSIHDRYVCILSFFSLLRISFSLFLGEQSANEN
jgi:hypothetical protein